jgi:hypothetical protein
MLRFSSSALSSLTPCNSKCCLPSGPHSGYVSKSSKSGFHKLLFIGSEGPAGINHFQTGTGPPEKSSFELLLWTASARNCTETKPGCIEEDDDAVCRRYKMEEIGSESESEEAKGSIKPVR